MAAAARGLPRLSTRLSEFRSSVACLRQHGFEIGNDKIVALQSAPHPIEQMIVPILIAVGSHPEAHASELVAEKEIA